MKGQAGGSFYKANGGGSNYLCLPDIPENGRPTSFGNNQLFGAEYQVEVPNSPTGFSRNLHDKEVTCSVCRRTGKTSVLMIPGKEICSYFSVILSEVQ